jgi:hypothetical protein
MTKYITILLLLPMGLMAQKTDSVQYNLHRATDSFMVNRCRAMCAIKNGLRDSIVFYDQRAAYFREEAFKYYEKWDPMRYDAKKQKTNLRFMNPNKYFPCPCH